MDRNTIVGLVLIGLILSVFAIVQQPSEAEIKKAEKERLAQQKEENEKKKHSPKDTTENTIKANLIQKLDDDGKPLVDENGMLVFTDSVSGKDTLIRPEEKIEEAAVNEPVKDVVKGELIRLENKKLIIDFTTKGGQVAAVRLKDYETYDDYAKNDGKIDPICLFEDGDASNGLTLPIGDRKVHTSDKLFTVKQKSDSRIAFEWKDQSGGSVEFVYTLNKDKFDLDYVINIRDFEGKIVPQNVLFNWDMAYRKTERLLSEQRRVSTICFNYETEDFSYLSEMADDDEEAEDNVDWISYKQSYFSSMIKPDKAFSKDGTKFKVRNYDEGHEREKTNLKDYKSSLNLNLNNVENASVRMNWFFGPNDYKVLKSYNSGYDNILNYGWGLFRWINLYGVQPLFNLLNSTGMAIGIAILFLTIIIKFILMPIQWKMYTSSAKMRILKPEIDEINQKYPDKADAMKKQMETMALYRESGASPFAGCVPMLIQMPILLAVFRFFPSTFALRQKSFLWAEDLSSYDSIYNFGFDIWLYGDHISLFTLLMAGTTLVYTHINSSNMTTPQQPGMPNMKVIMYIFPFMMIFFFNNYSSGLSYYYFISTLVTILITVLIKKFFVDEEKLKAKMAARKAQKSSAGPKKKSKFQERLEQMQKAQQDQLKNKKR